MEGLLNYSSEDEQETSSYERTERGSPINRGGSRRITKETGSGGRSSNRDETHDSSKYRSGNNRTSAYNRDNGKERYARDTRDNRDSREARDSRSMRETRDVRREMRDTREMRDARETRDMRESREHSNNHHRHEDRNAPERHHSRYGRDDYGKRERDRDRSHNDERNSSRYSSSSKSTRNYSSRDKRDSHLSGGSNHDSRHYRASRGGGGGGGGGSDKRDERVERYGSSRAEQHHQRQQNNKRSAHMQRSRSDSRSQTRSRSRSYSPQSKVRKSSPVATQQRVTPEWHATDSPDRAVNSAGKSQRMPTTDADEQTVSKIKPLMSVPLSDSAPKQPNIVAITSNSGSSCATTSAVNTEPPAVIQLPSYYNPSIINPTKYAEQVQKRKLLWGAKKSDDTAAKWGNAHFSQDSDGKVASKFMRLMGIKNAGAPGSKDADVEEKVAATVPSDVKSREAMFSTMEQQYEVARQATHTMRGVGLGFGSSRPY